MSTPAAKRRRVDAANVTLRKPFHSPVIRRPDHASASTTPAKSDSAVAHDGCSPKAPMQRGGVKRPASAQAAVKDDGDHHHHHHHHHPGGALLALVKAHRYTAQDAVLKDLDRKLETARQARRIEEASERETPGQGVDQELRDLVAKWKSASRRAAEELFEIVKERVANSGGSRAWKEMRQRQLEFYQGWDEEEVSKRDPDEDGSGRGFQEELEGHDGGSAEEEALQAKEQAEKDEDDECEAEFDMAQMLQSLNIDLALLGYDEVEGTWNN